MHMIRTHHITQLPIFPITQDTFEDRCVCAFLRCMKDIEFIKPEHIARAIENVADETLNSAANISRILVEQGLVAPKEAFPISFLQFLDGRQTIPTWQKGALTSAQIHLMNCW